MITVPASRSVSPELLDTMPPEEPAARASRRDLRRINALMFQTRIMTGLLRTHVAVPPRRIVELGCGDGHATFEVARAMAPAWPGVALTLVDAQPIVSAAVRAEISALGWTVDVVSADVFDWLGRGEPHELAIANLFLHHFEDALLSSLLNAIAGLAGTFIATEPTRSTFALLAARSVRAIGANAVTRHDALASVCAGFRGAELTQHWPGHVRKEGMHGPFTHVFAATVGPDS